MKQVWSDSKVMEVIKIDKMSEKLKKAFNLLEVILKGLNTVIIISNFFLHFFIYPLINIYFSI